jgi:glycosyltransferase involved in cell wall biosynthesis
VRLVAYTDNVELGGADLSLMHLLERLDAGVDVTVLGVAGSIVERVASARPGAVVRVVPRPRSGHDVRSLRAHIAAIRALAPDVVHANLASPWSCQYGIAAAAILRAPRIVAVYQLPVPAVSRAQRLAKRLTTPGVDRHVGVGDRTSREVEALVGLPASSVRTIHNGVPDLRVAPASGSRRAGVVGAIGRLEHQKGFDTLVRSMACVVDASLVVVGDGSERGRLEGLADEVGVTDRVEWEGWRDEPRTYLPAFDVVAFPSRFEGFPLAVLEALLARSAVVATDVGSTSEAVIDGETGILVPPDDPAALAAAIRRLLADAGLRSTLGANGRRLVLERFTADHMTRSFESLYDELLSRDQPTHESRSRTSADAE